MGNPVGEPLDVYAKHNFIIEIDGIKRAGFKSCSALEVEVSVIAYHEGGKPTPHKSPGKQTFPDITLERGVTDDIDFNDWIEETAKMATGLGRKGGEQKRTLDIVQLDRDGSERRRYTVTGAWPSKWTAGEWDGEADTEAVIEALVLTYDYFERTK